MCLLLVFFLLYNQWNGPFTIGKKTRKQKNKKLPNECQFFTQKPTDRPTKTKKMDYEPKKTEEKKAKNWHETWTMMMMMIFITKKTKTKKNGHSKQGQKQKRKKNDFRTIFWVVNFGKKKIKWIFFSFCLSLLLLLLLSWISISIVFLAFSSSSSSSS